MTSDASPQYITRLHIGYGAYSSSYTPGWANIESGDDYSNYDSSKYNIAIDELWIMSSKGFSIGYPSWYAF